MSTKIKFCGLTRPEDVRVAVELGAAFLGVVFAGGPRSISPEHARTLLENVTASRRVGVFGHQSPDEIARAVEVAGVDVIQLHGDPSAEEVAAIKRATGLETWAAMRVAKAPSAARLGELTSSADAILFDSKVDGTLGGTGQVFDWALLTQVIEDRRADGARFILAGGLTPDIVARAVAMLRPDVVDVSSGVESAPGVKDHGLMRAFAAAVREAS